MELSVLTTVLVILILQTCQVRSKSKPAKTDNHYQQHQQENQPSHYAQNAPAHPQQLQHQGFIQPLQIQRPVIHQLSGLPVQNQLHPQSQQQIIQLIQKILYNTQQSNQPTAMIIIAQPAYVSPANVGYGNTAHQLLNFFHNNPQARYQFVHGNTQAQPIPQFIHVPQSQSQPSQPVSSYPVLPPSPQYQTKILPVTQTTHMNPVQSSETYSQQSPLQLPQLAQLSAQHQHYYQQQQQQQQYQVEPETRQNDVDYPSSLPPIITGLENFPLDQQEKIKTQLGVHFGAPLKPLALSQNSVKNVGSSTKYQSLNTNEFVPMQEMKGGRSMSNVMSINKSTYM